MQQQPVCENCGIVIRWQPTIVGERVYCCAGCAQGGPCECDYENLPQPGDMRAMVLHPARSPENDRPGHPPTGLADPGGDT